MLEHLLNDAGVTVALALSIGLAAQIIARSWRLPGLVLLLAAGVLVGPDVANLVRPDLLREGLPTIVGFAVAVILFEGGLGLDLPRLLSERRAIQQLSTLGALVSALAGTVAAHLILEWGWGVSSLFGTLIMVTGPTVITPLLRRVKVKESVRTILEAEGVLVDALGAIVAAVVLEAVLHPSTEGYLEGTLDIARRLGAGAIMGAIGGAIIAFLLRYRDLVPEGLESVLTLALVIALFEISSGILHESGVMASVTAGIVVRNGKVRVEHELREFKEQLTAMLVGMLFVTLAADVRMAEVVNLGWRGLALALVVMMVIRPLSVGLGTLGAQLGWREKVFIAWIGPRGIVAAAVSSVFATQLDESGMSGGAELRAMVFLLIGITVLWSGFTGGLVANALGLRLKEAGWLILGANAVARMVGKLLKAEGEDVLCVDNNPHAVRAARRDGLRARMANGLDVQGVPGVDLDTRAGVIALTSNDEVNLIFIHRAHREARHLKLLMVVKSLDASVTPQTLEERGIELLSGGKQDLDRWSKLIQADDARLYWFRLDNELSTEARILDDKLSPAFAPLVRKRASKLSLVVSATEYRRTDEVGCLVERRRIDAIAEHLAAAGWTQIDEYADPPRISDAPRAASA